MFKLEPVTNRRNHDDPLHRPAVAMSHSPSSISPSSTSPHPDKDYEQEHRDVFSGRLHRIDVTMDIDTQAHVIVLHPSRPGAAPVYPRHSDAMYLISKTTQGHNGSMAQSYRHHTTMATSTKPPSSPFLSSVH
jgi:hypothetical protein